MKPRHVMSNKMPTAGHLAKLPELWVGWPNIAQSNKRWIHHSWRSCPILTPYVEYTVLKENAKAVDVNCDCMAKCCSHTAGLLYKFKVCHRCWSGCKLPVPHRTPHSAKPSDVLQFSLKLNIFSSRDWCEIASFASLGMTSLDFLCDLSAQIFDSLFVSTNLCEIDINFRKGVGKIISQNVEQFLSLEKFKQN